MKKQNQGITLISLVITIIILLILAGISISALTGSGLFEKAKLARNRTQEAQELENQMLLEYENQVNQLGGTSSAGGEEIKFTNINTADTNPAQAMPNGAKPIETDATKGIVIKDRKENEWTWVEVPKTEVFKTATGADKYEAIKTDLINYVTSPTNYRDSSYEDSYYEGCGVVAKDGKTAQQVYEEMYQKMLSSIYTNGGFWISRYELGIKGSNTDLSLGRTEYTEITDESPEAVSQRNNIPYNFLTCEEAQNLASKLVNDGYGMSSLMFGIQWDLTCKYLEEKADWGDESTAEYFIKTNSSSWGNYMNNEFEITSEDALECGTYSWIKVSGTKLMDKRKLLSTGSSEELNKMNIYDLAGNCEEWTLEKYIMDENRPCCHRGGNYFTNGNKINNNMCSSREPYGLSGYLKYNTGRASLIM